MTGRGRQNFIIIEDFMQEELKLRGTALLVYAVIYSFCKLTGRFYASVAYLASRCRASERCVQYALRKLCSLGYLEAAGKHEMFDTNVYVCTAGAARNAKCEMQNAKSECCDTQSEIKDDNSPELCEENKRAAPVGSGQPMKMENNEEFRALCEELPCEVQHCITAASGITVQGAASLPQGTFTREAQYAAEEEPYPESTFGCYGLEGAVNLTERQYDYLSGWVGELIAENYILRLESYILEHPTFHSHSHFKTIKRWLLQDMGV